MMTLKLGRKQKGLEPYKFFIDDDPGLTMTYLQQGQIWTLSIWMKKKCRIVHLSKRVVVYEMKWN